MEAFWGSDFCVNLRQFCDRNCASILRDLYNAIQERPTDLQAALIGEPDRQEARIVRAALYGLWGFAHKFAL